MVAALWNVVAGRIPGVGGRFVSSTLSEECPTKYGGGGGAHGDSARGTARGSRAGPPHADIPHGAAPLTRHAVGVVVGGVRALTQKKTRTLTTSLEKKSKAEVLICFLSQRENIITIVDYPL